MIRTGLAAAVAVMGCVRALADDAEAPDPRLLAEQYAWLLEQHRDLVCRYVFTLYETNRVDTMPPARDNDSRAYITDGLYIAKQGTVMCTLTPRYDPEPVDPPKGYTGSIQYLRGAVESHLSTPRIRVGYNETFAVMSIGSKGNYEKEGWGPGFTPVAIGMMGGMAHEFGTEQASVYGTICQADADGNATAAYDDSVDVDGDGKPDRSVRVEAFFERPSARRRVYYFAESDVFGMMLLRRIDSFTFSGGDAELVGTGYFTEYQESPYGLPFPKTGVRILRPLRNNRKTKDVALFEVTELSKPDDIDPASLGPVGKKGHTVLVEHALTSRYTLSEDVVLTEAKLHELEDAVLKLDQQLIAEDEARKARQGKRAELMKPPDRRVLIVNAGVLVLFGVVLLVRWWRSRRAA